MCSCQYCALSERCQFYQIESLPTPLKNWAIATLQPHNLSPRLSVQWNIHISSSKSKIISFRVPGAHNYNYFLNSLPQLNGELAYRLTKSIFTITMMKWILMLCNLCKTSYNVLIHSHVRTLELKFWGEFRFPEVSIFVNVDLWNEQFYSKEQTSIRELSETLDVLVVFLHLNKGLDAWGKSWISHVNSLRKTSTVLTPNIDALACGCKPRICSLNCHVGGNLSRKVLLMEFESGNVCI